MRFYVLAVAMAASLVGCTQFFGGDTYEDCILQGMKGVTDESAATAIKQACWKKYPPKAHADEVIPPGVLTQLTGHAGPNGMGSFSGELYNGNKNWTITQVTISLAPVGATAAASSAEQQDAKEYNATVEIKPLTTSHVSFAIVGPTNQSVNWSITGARGYPPKD